MTDQLALVVKRPLRPVRNDDVEACPTWPKALEVACKNSGLLAKSLAIEVGVDPALFSRMIDGNAGWTADKLNRFMDAAGTELPLMWLNYQRGYDVEQMHKRQSELERKVAALESQLAAERSEREVITRFVREARA